MSAPQTKERPASMLRAMFAGFGSLMSVMDKIRSKPAAEAPADAEALAPQTPEAPAAAETAADTAPAQATTTVPATAAADVKAEPAGAAPATAAAETATEPEAATETAATAEPAAPGALPLANYDELTVASLRARLRNLSNDDITQLMTYEMANQNRPEVVKMFRNRLIKMTSGLQKLES
jgi:hypothetical protein